MESSLKLSQGNVMRTIQILVQIGQLVFSIIEDSSKVTWLSADWKLYYQIDHCAIVFRMFKTLPL